ncbi:hypothetical protein O1611_g6282 [Lasiodiplodia mahajangana]|uniref:Uncharacterized protein n=1 Tax=Lasiodiplodia mahajangana TaxID=1108764 RepID=A0ACC2JIJ2_9PEZI|nr:hypothetical protein O1611_g6282 [Lasiodiplodia mahajangana]
MAEPTSRYTNPEGGWSSPEGPEVFDSDMNSYESSDIERMGSSSPSIEGLPAPNTTQGSLELSITGLQKLLQFQLEQGGVLPRNWNERASGTGSLDDTATGLRLPHPCLFKKLGESVAKANLLQRWIKSESKDCFCLQISDDLYNPFFVNSVAALLAAPPSSIRIATAIVGHNLETWQHASVEHLLMLLCFQLLSDADPNWDYSELLGDIKDAFSGANSVWRESLLWVLLRALVTSGENKHRVLALSVPSKLATLSALGPTIERLLELAGATERNLQILFFFQTGSGLNLETPYRMSIDTVESATKESLHAEISSWQLATIHTRKSLRFLEERLLHAFSETLYWPLAIFSALLALQYRPWVLKYQATHYRHHEHFELFPSAIDGGGAS